MKVAVCYSGQASRFFRDLNNFTQQLERFSENVNIDLFFSLWNDSKSQEEIISNINSSIDKVSKEKIKLIKFELPSRINPTSKYGHQHLWSKANNVGNMISMFTGIKNADKLRQHYEQENNFKYDVVVRSRPDVGFEGTVDYHIIKNILDNEAMVVFPKDYNWFNSWHGDCGMLNDQCFFAGSDMMTSITDMDLEKSWDNGCRVQPESNMWWRIVNEIPTPEHLKHKEIPWYKFMNFVTVLRGSRELVANHSKFERVNIERFKLDKILTELGIEFIC